MLSFTVRDLEAVVYVTVEVHKLCCTFCDYREVAEKQDLSHTSFNCDSPAPNVFILLIWRLYVKALKQLRCSLYISKVKILLTQWK